MAETKNPDSLIQIEDPQGPKKGALKPFAMGFRPFFLGGTLYALVVMGLWTMAYRGGEVPGADLFGPTMWWHAHAMVYGFALAVIAGFLLTAVRNWTGKQTFEGWQLGVLFAAWAGARIAPHIGASLAVAGTLDLLFNIGLLTIITIRLVEARKWRDVSIFSTKLLAITIGNALVYFGGTARRTGIYLGLYVVLAIVLTLGKRVFPFFIEKGLGEQVKLDRAPRLALLNLAAFLGFVIVELIWPSSIASAVFAGLVTLINARRLLLWAPRGIWSRPLLWVLIVGYGWIVVGFALITLQPTGLFSSVLATHALTVGGVGMVTLGMMVRVTLGHTGRNVRTPDHEQRMMVIFGSMGLATLIRVGLPLTGLVGYGVTVLLAQILWIISFGVFLFTYAPMLIRARVDGKPG